MVEENLGTYEALIRIMGPIFSMDVEYITVTIKAKNEDDAFRNIISGFRFGLDINETDIIAIWEIPDV